MYKKLIILISSIILLSCSFRNEYGRKRFRNNGLDISPNTNENAYKIIDTTKLYEIVSCYDTVNNQPMFSLKKTFLKFYADGRVGEFYEFNSKDVQTLDPKKAESAIYNYDGEKLVIQFYFEHPQGGGFIKNNVFKSSNDTLQLIGRTNLSTYKAIEIPKSFLKFKPDW